MPSTGKVLGTWPETMIYAFHVLMEFKSIGDLLEGQRSLPGLCKVRRRQQAPRQEERANRGAAREKVEVGGTCPRKGQRGASWDAGSEEAAGGGHWAGGGRDNPAPALQSSRAVWILPGGPGGQ